MTAPQIFIQKEDQECPDNYSVAVTKIGGQKVELELAKHTIVDKVYEQRPVFKDDKTFDHWEWVLIGVSPVPIFEYVTKDDEWGFFPMANIDVTFDKRYSKIVALREKKAKENK